MVDAVKDHSEPLSFSRAQSGDAEAIVHLVNSGYRGDVSRAGWTTEADFLEGVRTDEREVHALLGVDHSMFLLCRSGAELVGSVLLQREGDAAHLGMLVVRPTLQNRGIGKRLIEAAERIIVEAWAVKFMRMSVITRRDELIAYYERRGFQRTGIIQPFPHDPRSTALRGALHLEIFEKALQVPA